MKREKRENEINKAIAEFHKDVWAMVKLHGPTLTAAATHGVLDIVRYDIFKNYEIQVAKDRPLRIDEKKFEKVMEYLFSNKKFMGMINKKIKELEELEGEKEYEN